jgi:hypothetical protein
MAEAQLGGVLVSRAGSCEIKFHHPDDFFKEDEWF